MKNILLNPTPSNVIGEMAQRSEKKRGIFAVALYAGATAVGAYFLKRITENVINQDLQRGVLSGKLPQHSDKIASVPLTGAFVYLAASSAPRGKWIIGAAGMLGGLFHEINSEYNRDKKTLVITSGEDIYLAPDFRKISRGELLTIVDRIKSEDSLLCVLMLRETTPDEYIGEVLQLFQEKKIRGHLSVASPRDNTPEGQALRTLFG